MNEPIHVEEYRGHKIKIFQDPYPENPREWDNLGKICMSHGRYNLPNELNVDFKRFNSWTECIEQVIKEHDVVSFRWIYGYDHGGLSCSVSNSYPYNDAWDAGTLGFIVVTRQDALKEFGKKRLTKAIRETIEISMENEVDTYNHYLVGDTYYLRVVNPDGKELDSYFGIIGDFRPDIDEQRMFIDNILREEEGKQWQQTVQLQALPA